MVEFDRAYSVCPVVALQKSRHGWIPKIQAFQNAVKNQELTPSLIMNNFLKLLPFVLLLGYSFNLKASNETENDHSVEEIQRLSRDLSIVGRVDSKNPDTLIYEIVNNSKYRLYVNLQSLKKPAFNADVLLPNSKNGEFVGGYMAQEGSTHAPTMEDVIAVKGNVIVLKPRESYVFNVNIGGFLKEITVPNVDLTEKNITYEIRLQFDNLITGFDDSKTNKELFKTSFSSKPLRIHR